MTNKARKRIQDRARRLGISHLGAANQMRPPPGTATLEALRCDICNEPLFGPRADAMAQWFCEIERRRLEVVALFLNHKGACDRVLQGLTEPLSIWSFWDELPTLIGARSLPSHRTIEGLFDHSEPLASHYVWQAAHRDRLTRLARDAERALAAGWRPPASFGYSDEPWAEPLNVGTAAARIVKRFAVHPTAFEKAQQEASENAGRSYPDLESFIGALVAKGNQVA